MGGARYAHAGRSERAVRAVGGVIGGLAASAMDRRARRAGWPRARRRRARSRGDRLALDTGRRRLDPDCGRRDVRRLRPVGNVPRPRPGCCRQIVRRLTVTPRRDGGSDASRRPCPQFEHARVVECDRASPPASRPASSGVQRTIWQRRARDRRTQRVTERRTAPTGRPGTEPGPARDPNRDQPRTATIAAWTRPP